MTSALSLRSSVCAVIPHFRCEQWLAQAVESLLEQTRPPEAIVVIDDASEEPPIEILRAYPEVTLLASAENSGPYRLVQAVIDSTQYDAYLFQDADDWSAPDRLETLLQEAAGTGAELVGSHEVRVLVDEGDVVPVRYPLDVNAALHDRPMSFPLLHPTSLISRTLVCRLGGFATGMRFSGDAELLRRAGHVARIVNADHFGYFRRKRQGSLTLGSATALGSPARQEVQSTLAALASANARAVAARRTPDLSPWRTATPAELTHLAGPSLGGTPVQRPSKQQRSRPVPSSGAPIFVVGAPRSGNAVLAWALGQHRALRLVHDSRWLARTASDVVARAEEEAAPPPASFERTMAAALRSLLTVGAARPVAAGTELLDAAHALVSLFPDARFIHVVRDVEGTVAALAAGPTTDGGFYTGERAWRSWLAATEQGLLLERALGSKIALRVLYRDLVDHPEATIERCLAFLGEEPAAACVRPAMELAQGEAVVQPVPAALAQRCRELADVTGMPPAPEADQSAREQMVSLFQRAQHRQGLQTSLVERTRDFVNGSAPEGSTVAVISRGDPRMIELDGRRGWHLPQVEDGTYAGHHPADGADALEQLTRLEARGADHLAIPASSFWWLTWYDELREHLHASATLVAFHEEIGAIYRLNAPAPAPNDGKPPPPRFAAVPPRQEVAR